MSDVWTDIWHHIKLLSLRLASLLQATLVDDLALSSITVIALGISSHDSV